MCPTTSDSSQSHVTMVASPAASSDAAAATTASASAAAASTVAAPAAAAVSYGGNVRASLLATPPSADSSAAATPAVSAGTSVHAASSCTSAATDPRPTDSTTQADPTAAPPIAVRATRRARTPSARRISGSAGRETPDSSAQPTGIWLLLEDAANHLGVSYQSERQFRKSSELDTSRHIERGASVHATAPFSSFDYVCVLKDAPPGWSASANMRLKLPEFLRLCSHLSITATYSPDSETALNFRRYTGRSFTPRNVMSAFDDGLLYSSQDLHDKLEVGLKLGKRKCRGIRHPRVESYAPSHPDWCTQFGVMKRITVYHHVLCGQCKSDAVGNNDRSTQCCTFYRHITRRRHPELFDESTAPSPPQLPTMSSDETVEKT